MSTTKPRPVLPHLETARLTLRPRVMADLEACLAMDGDPAVAQFVAGPWADPAQHRAFVEARILTDYPPGLGYWSITSRLAPSRFLGWILLIPCDSRGADAAIEIGWRVIRAARGLGYATEAAAAVLQHAFSTLDLDEVIAEIHPENMPSLSVARKIGLQSIGLVPMDPAMPNGGIPVLRHLLTRAAFVIRTDTGRHTQR